MLKQRILRPPFCRLLENAGKKILGNIIDQIAAVGHLVLKRAEISHNGIRIVAIQLQDSRLYGGASGVEKSRNPQSVIASSRWGNSINYHGVRFFNVRISINMRYTTKSWNLEARKARSI
jgi:hypothetical protein